MKEKEKQKSIVLSIIIPAFNAGETIGRCLESIAGQSLDGMECIVVDDGSTDDTARIAESVMAAHPGTAWRLLRQENKGSSRARYAGVQAAAAALIGFADADDYAEPGYYEALYRCAVRTGADITAGEFTQEGVQKRQTNRGRVYSDGAVITPKAARLALFDRTGVYSFPWNKLFKRELLTPEGFPAGRLNGEDFTMVLSALGRAEKVALCGAAGYHYATRRGSQTLQPYGETKRRGYGNYKRIYRTFKGTAEEKRALARHIMLEYLSCLLLMYRSRRHDRRVEEGILAFVKRHRADYIRNGKDGPAAKCFAALINPVTHRILFHLWPRLT